MSRIARKTTQEFAAAATATPTLLAHAADDIIFFIITQDGGGIAISVTVATGWTVYDPGSASGGSRQALAIKRAASSSETPPVFNGATDEWILQQFIISDVDTTTAPDFTPASSAWNAVASKASPAATSANDDTLVFYSWGADASQKMRHKISEAVYLDNWRHSSGQVGSLVCYRQMFAAGSVPTVTMYAINANEGGHAWVIGFRNKSGGSLEPMPVVDATELRWYGDYGASHDATTTWGDLQDAGPTTINGIAVSSTAPTVTASSQTGFESTPNGSGTLLARNTNLATQEWVGGAHAVTSFDATGLVLNIQWAMTNITAATFGAEGVIIVLGDSAGGWVAYQLSKRQDTAALFPYWNQIAVGQATEYDSSGTFDITDLSWIGWGYHRLSGSTTNIGILFKNLTFLDNITLVGGGANSPCSPSVIANALNAEWFFKQGELLGSGMTLAKCLVNIGDGSNKLYYDASRTAMELPQAYDAATNRFSNFNASSLGVTINAAAGNTINLTAMAMNANQSQPLTVASGSSTSASYDFTGGAISNHAPVLKTGIPYVGATFASCGEIDAKGATLTGCTISDTTSTDAAIAFSENGGELDDCTIDVTGTDAEFFIELGAGVDTFTITDGTLTGTPGTNKVHARKTTGTVTINLSGSATLTSGDVTSEGATVSIVSDPVYQSVTLTDAVAGTRVQIYDTGSPGTELFNGTPTFPYTWTDSNPAVASRPIRLRAMLLYDDGGSPTVSQAKVFIDQNIGTCGTTASTAAISFVINQENDEVYDDNGFDGSTITGMTIVDNQFRFEISAGTIVTYGDDDVLVVDGRKMYAYETYWLFTEEGIRDEIRFINAVDPVNFRFIDFKLKNTTASPTYPVMINNAYVVDDATGVIASMIDYSGGPIFAAPDHMISNVVTVGGSNVITGDIADVAGQVQTGLTAQGLTTTRAGYLDNLDAAVSTRLATAGYTAPDNASVTAIKAKTDNLPADPASTTNVLTRLAAADYVAPANATVATIAAQVGEIHDLHGLDASNPLVVDDDADTRSTGSITQTVVTAGNVTTVTRT